MSKRNIKCLLDQNIIQDVMKHSVKVYVDIWSKDSSIVFSELPKDVCKGISHITNGYSVDYPLYISRSDIFEENNILYKFLKILMFGYPKAKISHNDKKGSQSAMHRILSSFPLIKESLENLHNKNFLSKQDFIKDPDIISLFNVKGVGLSTFSKFMYLLNVKVENIPCVILDSRVKKSFEFFEETTYLHTNFSKINNSFLKDYLLVNEELYDISRSLNIESYELEYLLFSYRGNN